MKECVAVAPDQELQERLAASSPLQGRENTIRSERASNAWKVLFILFLANLVNFFDRTIPAIMKEPIRHEWHLSDLQLGMITAAFTVIYAISGVPLGLMADNGSRRKIIAWGLIFWSVFTAAGAGAWNFMSFLGTRLLVGLGEASFAPASNSIIGDLFPAEKRSRALGIFMLGLPMGLMLAFFSVGAMVTYFGSWRAPFFIAMFPGLIIAGLVLRIKEPERGAAEKAQTYKTKASFSNPVRKVLTIPTMRWLIVAGLAGNFAVYAVNSFIVSLLVRYFHMALPLAAASAGVMVGVTGLAGLIGGGWVADKAHKRSKRGRLMLGAVAVALSAVLTWLALRLSASQTGLFVAIFSIAWLLQYFYYICVYPAIQDVVEPRLRATAMAVFFAAMYIFGGAFGSVVVGKLSDVYTLGAMRAEGAVAISAAHAAMGLHGAFILVPIALAITALAIFKATLTFPADAQLMTASMETTAAVG
ncbi:MFS transporter [Ochrobactrum intermedium]|uniref:spinster family MFS transporter n=1 Tax=Brucella intermedia TaxID=94625 RepID=UPI00128E2038|nr:MFS transporter [Brucella intermedia]MPR64358.1 MFS transporter [Brucella intermedia]